MTAPSTTSTTQIQPKPRVKPSSIVYWMRVALAIAAGATNALLNVNVVSLGDLASFLGIAIGVAFYLASIIVVQHVLHYGEAELRGKNRNVTLGGGTFLFLWIMTSVLFYTVGL